MMKRRSRTVIEEIVVAPRVAVIGHCAAGKSTLVRGLRLAGIDAVASAQEHSEIAHLWRRTRAQLLVFLDIDLDTIRVRRGSAWPEQIFELQETRLHAAKQAADLVIDASRHQADGVLFCAREYVERWRLSH